MICDLVMARRCLFGSGVHEVSSKIKDRGKIPVLLYIFLYFLMYHHLEEHGLTLQISNKSHDPN